MEYFPYRKDGPEIIMKNQVYSSNSSDDSRKVEERKTKSIIKMQHKAEVEAKKSARKEKDQDRGRSS